MEDSEMKGELSMRSLLLAAAAALVVAAPAAAGGWATAGLGPPDDGLGAGDTWNAQVTVMQHGVTPLVGVQPAVIITNASTGKQLRFEAKATDQPGVYLAKVKFPSEGTWRYAVYDGFTQYGGQQTHTFAPVQIGAGSGDGFSIPNWTWGLALAGLGIAAIFLLIRRSRPSAAPVAQP
jgi:hypothetical protein